MKYCLELWLKIWLYVIGAVSIALLAVLFNQWGELSWVQRLVWFSVIILPFHAWEEWRLPGGLHYGYNLIMRGSDTPDIYPMNRLSDMLTIFPALLFGIWVATFHGEHPIAVIGMFLFCAIEIVMHTFGGFRMRRVFRDRGKRTIYNPGLATSYLMFLPVSIGFIYLFSTGLFPVTFLDFVKGIASFIGVVVCVVVVPELIFMSRETSYPFRSRGYWSKFVG